MATTYLTRTSWGTATNRQKFTQSFWIKRSAIGVQQALLGVESGGNDEARVLFRTDDTFEFYDYQSGYTFRYITNRKFKDCSAWYNIVLRVDTDNGTAANRVRIYINGVQETSFSTATAPSQNLNTFYNSSGNHIVQIGRQSTGNSYFNGSMSHINFLDGEDRDSSFFGSTDSTTGEWKINANPSGVNYGTNGYFILKNGNTITDSSPNSNNFSVGGGLLTKTEDCPDNVFITLNPLFYVSSAYTLIQGNLRTNGTSSNADRSLYGTIGASSGKYYFETKIDDTYGGDSNNIRIGIVSDDQVVQTVNNGTFFSTSRGYAYYGQDGSKRNNGNTASYGNTFTINDIIGCAFDLDNNKIYWSKNNVWQNSGDPTSGATGTGSAYNLATGYSYLPAISNYYTQDKVSINFGNGYFGATAVSSAGTNASGNGIFEYAVPTGYTALSTKGLNL